MLIKFCFFVFLFIYVINLKTTFFTFPIFYIFAPIGLLLVLKDFFTSYSVVERKFCVFFGFIFLAIIANALSFLINQSGDLLYYREVFFYSFISFFYAYFLNKIFLKIKDNSLDKLVLYFSAVVAVQLLISFVLFLNKGLFDVFFSFFDSAIGYSGGEAIDKFNEQRIIAIGNPFFGSAIINCFTLIILSIQFKYSNYKKIYMILWCLIVLFGIASARTTILGVLISFLILLKAYKVSFKYLLSIFLVGIIVFNFLYFTNERIQTIIDFSFNFLFDFRNSQASSSTGELIEMFKILPNKTGTWIFGDNLFKADNGYYYKGIDVGYSRIIFANGIIGLFVFLAMQIYMVFNIKFDKENIIDHIFLVSIILILNFKGVANLTSLILVFFIYTVFSIKIKQKAKGEIL